MQLSARSAGQTGYVNKPKPAARLSVQASFRSTVHNAPLKRWQLARPAQQVLATSPSANAPTPATEGASLSSSKVIFQGVHHVALICRNLENSLEFYQGILGLQLNPDRPDDKLPYRGAWLWIGPEMIHLMELPNPDPVDGRPEHGGRDRHTCVGCESIEPLVAKLEAAGVPFTRSMSGRPAIFFRDPDANCLEVVQINAWR